MNKGNDILIPEETIISKIYQVREQKVMLDRDLADIYGVKGFRLREQVKRNSDRFPEHFMFQLTEDETNLMVSQNAIPSRKHLGGYLPYVFTEYGLLMLANVLKSERAIKMSIRIIEIFVKLREMMIAHKDIYLRLDKIENIITFQDEQIISIIDFLKEMENQKFQESEIKKRKRIGYII